MSTTEESGRGDNMEHKIWKGSFVISALVTVLWAIMTIGAAFVHWNDPGLAAGGANLFCLLLGCCSVPVMALICAYLAKQAFR